ncbi:diacylglycerol/lipid kinase family protein [Kocuria tytonis]|uniref:DAGKc domain-containing protein n=1 Tax=Kocuria tytonis TaxID=2054280 RepID=A0A495A9G0_9MICC|nr:diacylglycerol kinase family protein [Kocuria tytonis]RKQ36679.1 hypothetical protein C1C97_003310 [Kocuria tytonis]
MTPRAARDVLLVHNGASRTARGACERAAGILRAGGYRPEPLAGASAAALGRALTETLRARSTDVAAVVAVGGDGMVHLVLQALHTVGEQGVTVPFGLVPAGSGNDLARHHGVPTGDPERAAGRVLRGLESPSHTMDLLHVTCADGSEHVCATAVCLGLDARVNARANRWSRVRVPAKYAAALALELAAIRARRYELSWTSPDGTVRAARRAITFLTVANTSSFGGGLTIVPRTDATDGVADLFTVSDVGPARLVWLFPRLWLGTHESLREVSVEPVTAAAVAVTGVPGTEGADHRDRDAAHGDGERLGPLPVSVRVLPAALHVLF